MRLLRARRLDDGLHSGTALSDAVRAGRMLRLRRGVYVEVSDWVRTPPWGRHLITVIATAAQEGEVVFCRESALALHGVPLLEVPDAVRRRCTSRGAARRVPAPSMTGSRSRGQVRGMLAAATGPGEPVPTETICVGLPTHRLEPTLPAGMSRSAARRAPDGGEPALPREELDASVVPWCAADVAAYVVEPLALAVVDTVPRLSFAEGVVILDAVLGGHTRSGARVEVAGLAAWTDRLPSRRLRERWDRALAAADPRAESPGESWSRVRLDELGFELPELQSRIDVEDRTYWVDVEWQDAGIAGEFDGGMKYTRAARLSGRDPSQVVYAEKVREDAIRSTGRDMVRWGWAELRHPERLARLLVAHGVPRPRAIGR